MADTFYSGTPVKSFIQSGQFTSTIKDSHDYTSISASITGCAPDSADMFILNKAAGKLTKASGQFTSTVKSSYDVTAIDSSPQNISTDGTNTPWVGDNADKLYLQSGSITSTLKTSVSVTSVDTWPISNSWDGVNTLWTGATADKLYLQSGQFTTTLKTSEAVGAVDTIPAGISYTSGNTVWGGATDDKLMLQSGQFTSTIKTSQSVTAVSQGLEHGSITERQAAPKTATATALAATPSYGTATTTAVEPDTIWSGDLNGGLYIQSGQFTTTVKSSTDVTAVDTVVADIAWDGTNAPWAGGEAGKLYLQSGSITSTVKTSETVSAVDNPIAVSWDGANTPWMGNADDKLYLQSGQFTSTLKTSESIGGVETLPAGTTWDGTNTPWSGYSGDKHYLTSGQFTSTLKTSLSVAAKDVDGRGLSWTGANTLWTAATLDKLMMSSGQFTTTIKDSTSTSSRDTIPWGIDTLNFAARVPPVNSTALDASASYGVAVALKQRAATALAVTSYGATVTTPIVVSPTALSTTTYGNNEITGPVTRNPTALNATSYGTASVPLEFSATALPVTSYGVASKVYSRSVSHGATFGHTVVANVERNVSVAHSLALTDIVNVEYNVRLSSAFTFFQVSLTNVKQYSLGNAIGFAPIVAKTTDYVISVSSDVFFEQEGADTKTDSASNSVAFTSAAYRAGGPVSSVAFTDAATAVDSTGTLEPVGFTQEVVVGKDFTRPASNGISFGQTAVAYIERNCDVHEYTPVGVAPVVTIGTRTDVTLVCAGDSITLRNPGFGNSESLEVNRAFNISRGGTPNIVRDTQWPETTEQTISFEALTRAKALELLDFISNCLGLLITYTDYENRAWEGIIINPETAVIDEGDCKYNAELILASNPV